MGFLSDCRAAAGNVGCRPVGEYTAASRPFDILVSVFGSGINAAMLPAFMRVGAESRHALARLVTSASTLSLVVGVPVAMLTTFFAPDVLYVLAGPKYLVAAPALAIIIWTFPCTLVLAMLYGALYAVHKQRVVVAAFAVTLVFNVGLNLTPHSALLVRGLSRANCCVGGA